MIAIVGGGLAGTCLVKTLIDRKIDFRWYYDENWSASHISSGIIQPVSGRNYVFSWKYDKLVDCSLSFYRFNDKKFIVQKDIIRKIYPPNNPEKLEEKLSILSSHVERLSKDKIRIFKSYQVEVQQFINAIKFEQSIVEKSHINTLNYDDIELKNHSVRIKNQEYRHVIFAEGIKVLDNPWFSDLQFVPNRGEALKVNIKDYSSERIIHDKKTLCDFQGQHWVGSSFDRVSIGEPIKTEKVRSELIAQLEEILGHSEYSVLEHFGAFRSTTLDTKPIIGSHKDYPQISIFNGFGSKGASLIPYFSQQLVSNIIDKTPIEYQVSIERFD